jgi:AhpD family alkylhydroperoxidase
MARLPYPDLEAASEGVRDTWEALPVKLGVFRMLAHAETAMRPCLRLGQAILTQLELDPALRELAILRVARLTGAEYEWVQHVSIARAVGVRGDQVAALARDDIRGAEFDARERDMLSFATDAVLRPRSDDHMFAAVAERFTAREIVELLITVGFYAMLARVMTQLEIELDEPAGTGLVEPG